VVVIDEAYTEFVRDPEVVDGIEVYKKYPNVVIRRARLSPPPRWRTSWPRSRRTSWWSSTRPTPSLSGTRK
jgi:hypothetical protein